MEFDYLFVYGTLGSKLEKDNDVTFIGTFFTEDTFKLYNVGTFPALVLDENGSQIKGDLYSIPKELWKELDTYEDVPKLFKRTPIQLKDQNELKISNLQVYSYIYNESVKGLKEINSWI